MPTTYDAFLSYSRDDEQDVRTIYEYLMDSGLHIWLDDESIRPGDDWIDAIQDGLSNSKSCVVFFRREPGPWQQEEFKAALRRKKETVAFRIIPVLLPGAPERPRIPPFIQGSAWVDLRAGLFNVPALKKLVQAIRGSTEVAIHVPSGPHPPNVHLPTGYKADVEKIIGLLIGESLYKERYVSIRELIQNAVDACERRRRNAFGLKPEIIVRSDTVAGYFEVADNGEGMNAQLLSDCFAVIGKSIRDEPSIFELISSDEASRLHLIAKFGVGFISSYILSKTILISTSFHGEEQINLEITGITQPFQYSLSSQVGRLPEMIGTTVRVYLKSEYCQSGTSKIDIPSAVRLYCRHVPNLEIIEDGQTLALTDEWNLSLAKVVHSARIPYKYEIRLGMAPETIDLITSHAGFYVCKNCEAILPACMPTTIGGEINFFPGSVDLNVARDTIVDNAAALTARAGVSALLKQLLVKAVEAKTQDLRATLSWLLMYYFEAASEYEARRSKFEVPLRSAEAAELLIDAWYVSVSGKEISFRNALEEARKNNRNRVYYYDRLYDRLEDVQVLLRDDLAHRGFVVVPFEYRSIELKHGGSKYVHYRSVLTGLSKRYGFDLLSVAEPWEGDIKGILTDLNAVSPVVRSVVNEIARAKGKEVRIGRLRDAPAAFQLKGHDYLNLDNPVFSKLDETARDEEVSAIRAFVRGLLQYDLRET